jgi:hypothetical protein
MVHVVGALCVPIAEVCGAMIARAMVQRLHVRLPPAVSENTRDSIQMSFTTAPLSAWTVCWVITVWEHLRSQWLVLSAHAQLGPMQRRVLLRATVMSVLIALQDPFASAIRPTYVHSQAQASRKRPVTWIVLAYLGIGARCMDLAMPHAFSVKSGSSVLG